MAAKEWFGINRTIFVVTLVFSLIFLGFSISSAVNYSTVELAQERIVLENPDRIVELRTNGTLFVGFAVDISNPSQYIVKVESINWYSEVENSSGAVELVANYTSQGISLTIGAHTVAHYSFGWYVTGAALERLNGFINYSSEHGAIYTYLTVPYAHSFRFVGHLDDFNYQYTREDYLNGLVTIRLDYVYGIGGG